MVATTASAGADDDAIEELEVILGHPFLKASGDVSLFEAMGAAHWMLIQTHDVLHRDRGDIDDKQRCLLLWVSLQRKQMASEKEKAKARQKHTTLRRFCSIGSRLLLRSLMPNSRSYWLTPRTCTPRPKPGPILPPRRRRTSLCAHSLVASGREWWLIRSMT
jgi:hypothetical protein